MEQREGGGATPGYNEGRIALQARTALSKPLSSGPHQGYTRLQRRPHRPPGHICGATPGYNEGRAALQARHMGLHQITTKARNALQVTSASPLVPG